MILNGKNAEDFIVMGIESSCDETAVSLVKGGRKILADKIISSSAEHVKFGGVVPEIASRAHTEAIGLAAKGALKDAGLDFCDIDAVAVTYGAGLLGALLVGVSYAKSLAYALGVPLIPVNHIRAHISAGYLESDLKPPFVSLLASGGHTAVIKAEDYMRLHILGCTLDDAAGEAFDKVARVLGLPYPGGPSVQKLAERGEPVIALPKMLKGDKGYSFSYSGLKTAVINVVHNAADRGEQLNYADVAASFQKAAVDALVEKAEKAIKETGFKTVTAGGGVAANGYLRDSLEKLCRRRGVKLYLPEKRLCTDNGAMIAAEGFIRYVYLGKTADLRLNAHANLPIDDLNTI